MHTRSGPIQVIPFAVKSDIAVPCHDLRHQISWHFDLSLGRNSFQLQSKVITLWVATPLSSWPAWALRNKCLTDTRISTCLGIFPSASDTAWHRFCSIENTRLDPTSSFPAVTKLGNRLNYCGRNSSEPSCMSSAASNQSVVPGFSESPQSCCEEGARRLVDIYLPFRECKSFTTQWYSNCIRARRIWHQLHERPSWRI